MSDPTWPSGKVFAITPHDSTNFEVEIRQIYVGAAGDITVVNQDDTTCLFSNVPAGAFLGPFFVKRVNSTATTASSLVGFV